MEKSHIEWTDHTFNPWFGCTKVSPGCLNCYAEGINLRFHGGKNWGKGSPRGRPTSWYMLQPLRWNWTSVCGTCGEHTDLPKTNPGVCPKCYGELHRPRVFSASLSDWLDDEVPIEWLAELLQTIHITPNVDWLLLSKRPQNWRDRIAAAMVYLDKDVPRPTPEEEIAILAAARGRQNLKHFKKLIARFKRPEASLWLGSWLGGKAPDNVWLGTSVEDQTRADERIPNLIDIPAKVRFLSCEPLLGPVNLTSAPVPGGFTHYLGGLHGECRPEHGLPDAMIHWVICGGESGRGARPMHPDWARSLRDQCQAAGVAFFFKQWGEWSPVGFHGDAVHLMQRMGKGGAGRLLDGAKWDQFPKVEVAE